MERWKNVTAKLRKFTIKDLLTTVSKLYILPVTIDDSLKDFADVRRKEELVKLYVDAFKESTDESTALGQLDLLYVYQRSYRKYWTIYELIGINDDPDFAKDPEELQREIHNELEAQELNSKVAVQLHDGAYWLRISVSNRRTRRLHALRETTAFCVHYRGTNSIALAGLNKGLSDSILQALGEAFEFQNAEITALQDRNLKGILQLHYDKENKHLIPIKNVNNPLATAEVRESVKEDLNERIIHLQKNNVSDRKHYSESKFGVDEIPPVKKLTYEIYAPFAGQQHAPQTSKHDKQPFHCRVEFEGPNVIEGFSQMIRAGICQAPLPRYLADVRTMGKTKFLIRSNVPANESS